jgi:ribosomal protein S12 methylthiotransferase
MKTHHKNKTINVISLGCSKNLVDSEQLLAQLKANNYEVLHDAVDSTARTVVINTCGFIQDAKQESVDTILEQVRAKEQGLIDQIFVMGCLSQRYTRQLKTEIPELDGIAGVNCLEDVVKMLGGNYRIELTGERLVTTPSHYAYLKISEGCDRKCSFCAIPMIRGRHVSKPIDEIAAEARKLVAKGVKEIILIAQDLTFYGLDIYKKQSLARLLKEIAAIRGLEWIRLHYAYPASFPKDILKVIRDHDNICNYLDIPFQHISDNILRKMKRGIDSRQTYKLIDVLKREVPGLTLRTTLMVGHPDESEKDFGELMDFVTKIKFDRLGVFQYSEEEDTYSARHYSDNVSPEIKEKRMAAVMETQEKISLENNINRVGQSCKTIIDRKEGKFYIGRMESDSPEVDNELLIESDQQLTTGKFYRAVIEKADAFDLYGRVQKITGTL